MVTGEATEVVAEAAAGVAVAAASAGAVVVGLQKHLWCDAPLLMFLERLFGMVEWHGPFTRSLLLVPEACGIFRKY